MDSCQSCYTATAVRIDIIASLRRTLEVLGELPALRLTDEWRHSVLSRMARQFQPIRHAATRAPASKAGVQYGIYERDGTCVFSRCLREYLGVEGALRSQVL